MASLAFTDASVTIASNDLSVYGNSVNIEITGDALEDTAFADTARSRIGGLLDSSGSADFNADFADNLLDEILQPLVGTVVAFAIRPTSAVVGTGNPEYQFNAVVTSYNAMQQGVGDLATASLSWEGAGAVTRAVA